MRPQLASGFALVVLLLCGLVALGGEASGVVTFRDGSKARKVAVSGLVRDGGVLKTVYTDDQGNFRLSWTNNNDLEKIYVRGNTVARNIKNGSKNIKLVIDP